MAFGQHARPLRESQKLATAEFFAITASAYANSDVALIQYVMSEELSIGTADRYRHVAIGFQSFLEDIY
jgi:hypothetical protein